MKALRYCLLPTVTISMGKGAAVVRRFDDKQPLVISSYLAKVINHCRGLHTLATHEKRLSRLDPFSENIALHNALNELLTRGFLIAETDISQYFVHSELMVRPMRPAAANIAIVTNNRITTLKRTVESILRHSKIHDEDIQISIYDDSRSTVVQSDNVAMLQSLLGRERCELRYANRLDRKSYLLRICQLSGIEPRTAEFALLGLESQMTTIGANRNSALLDLAGSPCLFVDDDVIFQAAPSPRLREGIHLSSGYPAQSEFYEDIDPLLNSLPPDETYIPSLHNSLLGMQVQDCIRGVRDNLRTIDCNPVLWRSVLKNSARVSVTQMGIIGDSAQGSRSWLLSTVGKVRSVNLESEETYHKACTTSYARRIPNTYTITDSSFCMTYATAVDNSSLLPPFFPVGRNSDGIFGVLLRTINPDNCMAHLPYGIVHQRPTSVPFDRDRVWRDVGGISISDLIIVAVKSYVNSITSGGDNVVYSAIGQHLINIANMGNYEFLDFFKQAFWKRNAERIERFEQLLEHFNSRPVFWAKDITKAIEVMLSVGSEAAFGLPFDIDCEKNIEERIQVTRKLVHQYGLLLKSWPILREAAERRIVDPEFRVSRRL